MNINQLLPQPSKLDDGIDQGDEDLGTHSDLMLSNDSIDMEMNGERNAKEPLRVSCLNSNDNYHYHNNKIITIEDNDEHFELAPARLQQIQEHHLSSEQRLIEMKVKQKMNMTTPNIANVFSGSEYNRHCQSVVFTDEVDSQNVQILRKDASEYSHEGGSSSSSNKVVPISSVQNDGGSQSDVSLKGRPTDSRVIELPANKIYNKPQDPKKYRVNDNYISTTKYSIFTFLPLGLLYQFLRFSNIYFLIVTILQCIPSVSPLNPYTAVMPMVFVLSISMLREGYEDYQRYKSD